ncbi:helix-turn-helix domain-containing protein [Streptomyces sp. SL13]|uniref:Helix-turn-helix domain-containing protein n=1 Tax=Streptantibioticus silvisoli TaxID=2705255 RepID=A0AA90H8Z6_9ACTN|nr:helix-turn-helix domain-containing protein [Streptantibioticus silvisoli]MDI5973073.1 helix-turn-helix domain-containing protein [Streptantibioticus silvisoli]
MTTGPPQDDVAYPRELSAGARALAARCVPRVNELARRMSRTAPEEARAQQGLPIDVKNTEVAAAARYGLRLFVRRTHGGDYASFRERAARHAEEGMPLHLLLRAHATGTHLLWKTLRDTAGPGEESALIELSGLLLLIQEGMAGAVAETYLDEQAALVAEQREQREAFVRGLLDGTSADTSQHVAFGIEHGGLVLYLRTDRAVAPIASLRPGVTRQPVSVAAMSRISPVVARRRRRRIQTVLDRAFGTEVLTLLHDDDGHAIVPARPGAVVPSVPPDGLADRLRRACGDEVRIAAVPVDRPSAIADAARTACEVVRVAHASGRPPGLHRLNDVLLEFHLSRRDESSGLIAALLDPIGERPDLVETLRIHLEHQQDRRGTARRLGLHPNTVDNRLARIAELTGLDLTSPRGTALALAALLLRERPEPVRRSADRGGAG